jgi:uncharacterized protein
MQTAVDKLITLKSVSMFAETTDEILDDIVGLLADDFCKAGETIFSQGDLGTCLYIIAEGKVRVHDGERTLNFLGKRDVFGEMSALDPEPRSATVTAVEDTHLFRLDREPLFDLMKNRSEVTQGIVHVLCGRLRARMRDLVEDYTYMQQFARVTSAASAIEAGIYEPESLDEVARRTDALGQLARVFQRMALQVHGREQRLKREVEQLRIEIDEVKRTRQVTEIAETDYFRALQKKARGLRQVKATDGSGAATGPDVADAPDYEGAKRHALERLANELAPELSYHSVRHTRDEVLPAVERLAAMEGITGDDLMLLQTAAVYHDIGFVEKYSDNEPVAVRIASEVLPRFRYNPAQIEVIVGIIMATKLPQSPTNRLEEIIADADLDIFGSDDFTRRNEQLRAELAAIGVMSSDEEWYRGQLEFMKGHSYFTSSARALLQDKKQRNIQIMEERLRQATKQSAS